MVYLGYNITIGDDTLGILKCNGIILKSQDIGENDKLLWIFTDKLGKISAVAKGAKKSKSKYFSAVLPFCYGEYMVFKGKSMYTISEGKIAESFQELLNDLETLTYASYLCELMDISLQEEDSNPQLFKLLVTSLYLLKTGALENDLLVRAFELKLLKLTGYGLNFERCTRCRAKLSSSNYVDLQYSGGICDDCDKVNGIYVERATYNALKFLNDISLDKIYRLSLSEKIKDELYKVMSSFISNNYSRVPKSLQMFDFIKESELNK